MSSFLREKLRYDHGFDVYLQEKCSGVNKLYELVGLTEEEKDAKGIVATPREIAQQPASWETTRRIFEQHSVAIRSFLVAAGVRGPESSKPTVILTGAGSSDYICQTLALLFRKEWGCEAIAIASTDMLLNMSCYLTPGRTNVCISFSRSGDSPEGIAVLQQALEKYPEVRHLVITCNERGRMADLCRNCAEAYVAVLDDTVNDRGLAMTSSFTNMVVFGQFVAHSWRVDAYLPIFEEIVMAGEAFLPIAAECAETLATAMYERVCVLGSGALTGVAKESALKVLEMTAGRVKTMSESVLGLRHGPMAALDTRTLLVCFASGDARMHHYEFDLLREVGAKGIVAERVVVGPAGAGNPMGCAERYLGISGDIPDLYRPPVDVMLGQLLGLYCSLAHGLKPDRPSPGGVISRVVGEFAIYE